MTLYVGTSSYSLKEWVGSFYSPQTPAKDFLRYYASRLGTVEINYTYRHFPRNSTSAAWAAQTPDSFRFSLKMHQSVTHIKRLKGVDTSISDFLKALGPLGPRLGVVLVQLPPSFRADFELLEETLEKLPVDKKFAFEFRHPSWDNPEIIDLLRRKNVALCNAETRITDAVPPVTASHAYIRVRQEPPYSEEELKHLQRKIEYGIREADELYVHIRHDKAGLAPRVAMELQSKCIR
ncbi:MAG: DUF72 domain-containing protein [Desulfobacteraceae bacterium]|nr:MAG: DUF72 domain-containing protein [Desulfobacteraceae bacterium]